jgi:hypothetical protein
MKAAQFLLIDSADATRGRQVGEIGSATPRGCRTIRAAWNAPVGQGTIGRGSP